ncbi:MAG: hypothetical protein K6F34_10975 [Lachnospiraceae bacterium]|nr:hypothetical protein [Lachnospiraceae bacterium]
MKTSDRFINRILRRYLFPTILTILGTTITGFINSLIVGSRLGHEALAAINVISSFTFLFAMLGCLISIGASSAASVAIGRGEEERVGKYTTYSLVASIVIPVIISVLIMLVYKELMTLQGVSNRLYHLSREYSDLIIPFGFLTTLMYYPFNFLRLDGRAAEAMYIFGGMTVLDIVLVLSFTGAGLGLKGVAAAVVMSTAVADAAGIACMFRNKESNVIKLLRFSAADIGWLTKSVWSRGGAAGLNNLCNMLRTMILNAWILKYFGAGSAAVFAVACAIINLTSASVSGGGQTIVPLTGIFYGERDSSSLKILMNSGIRYTLVIHAVLLAAVIPLAGPIAGAFGLKGTPEAAQAAEAIIWIMVSLIPASVLNVFIFYYSTLKKVLLSCLLVFLRSLGFVLLFSAIFIFGAGGRHLYASFLLAELFTLAVMLIAGYVSGVRHSRKYGFLYIDRMPEQNYISFSVGSSTEGAVEASKRMAEFCDEHEVDAKVKSFLPMAIEEMLLTINEQCLKDQPDGSVDVRIYIDEDGLIMRVRCGGIKFDPVAWYKEKSANMTAEEMLLDDALGMKMIISRASEVMYQNTFGTNNLIVIL